MNKLLFKCKCNYLCFISKNVFLGFRIFLSTYTLSFDSLIMMVDKKLFVLQSLIPGITCLSENNRYTAKMYGVNKLSEENFNGGCYIFDKTAVCFHR